MRFVPMLLCLASLVACSPDQGLSKHSTSKADQAIGAQSGPKATIDPAKLLGTWKVVSVNGAPVKLGASDSGINRTPRLTFSPTGFGGNTGCNDFGGMGLLRGTRYFTSMGPSTLVACADLSAQETAMSNVLLHAPNVAFGENGRLTLKSKSGVLELQFDAQATAKLAPLPEPKRPYPLAGTSWQIYQIDGDFLTPRNQRDSRPLTFEADQLTVKAACAIQTGPWVQNGTSINLSGDLAATPDRCSPQDKALDARIKAILANNPNFQINDYTGPNSLLLIASEDGWFQAMRNPSPQDEATLLKGHWLVVGIDGASPVASSNPTLSFGATRYEGSTGCNGIGGNFLAHIRRFYTMPGPQTEKGCGPLTAQEERMTALLAASPRVALKQSGNLVLIDDRGQLELKRDEDNKEPIVEAPVRTVEASTQKVEVLLWNSKEVPNANDGRPTTVSFADRTWSTNAGCGGLKGDWVKREGRVDFFTNGEAVPAASCPAAQKLWTDRFMGMFNAQTRVLITDNGDFLMAGQDQWLIGRTSVQREGK